MLNHNKRSITLNTKAEKGKEVLQRLVETCDVLVENFAPGALDRMGFGWDQVQKINPRMIRSEEHTSELQSLMRISYAVFCLKKKKKQQILSIHYHSINMTHHKRKSVSHNKIVACIYIYK